MISFSPGFSSTFNDMAASLDVAVAPIMHPSGAEIATFGAPSHPPTGPSLPLRERKQVRARRQLRRLDLQERAKRWCHGPLSWICKSDLAAPESRKSFLSRK